ncbi:MAG: hypothetical protein KDC71_21550, partial [Acidobacteria bacterium]|nr:hypothetical protein [Acidobacteriota bacterium]
MDLRLNKTFAWKRTACRFYLDLFNLYNHNNIRAYDELYWFFNGSGQLQINRDYEQWLPRVPSFGFSVRF